MDNNQLPNSQSPAIQTGSPLPPTQSSVWPRSFFSTLWFKLIAGLSGFLLLGGIIFLLLKVLPLEIYLQQWANYSGQGYTLEYPSKWQQSATQDFEVVFLGPKKDDFAPNLGINKINSSSTLEELVKATEQEQQKQYRNFQLISEKKLTVSSLPAVRETYNWFDQQYSLEVTQIQQYFIIDNVFYTLNATDLRKNFPKTKAIFERMMDSFKLTNVPSSGSHSEDLEIAKYDKDSDGNGIPDFVETALGYDPLVDDCARDLNTNCGLGETGQSQAKERNTLLILDSSGSMALILGKETRMSVAKSVIKDWITKFKENENLGLMVYGHKGSNSAKDKAVSCQGIDLFYPLQKVDKEKFNQAIDSFSPNGWTPIAASFLKAEKEVFAGHENEINRILLVSDGIETCDGNPVQAAEELKQSNIAVVIDVIGFNVDSGARDQLKQVAQVTEGKYYDANTKEEFWGALDQWSKNFWLLKDESKCLTWSYLDLENCIRGFAWGTIPTNKYFKKGALNYLTGEYCLNLEKQGKKLESQKCLETRDKIMKVSEEQKKKIEAEYEAKRQQNLKEQETNKK